MDVPNRSSRKKLGHKLVAPDGGWGYIIILSAIIIHYVSLAPSAAYGIYISPYLATFGEELNKMTLFVQLGVSMVLFSGFATGPLIRKFGLRTCGMVGATLVLLGGLGDIFGTTFVHMLLSTAVSKGFGLGMLMTTCFSVVTVYFDKKLNMMMGLFEAFVVIGMMLFPPFASYVRGKVGHRYFVGILFILQMLNVFAVATFRPVKRYMRKVSFEIPDEEHALMMEKENRITLEARVFIAQVRPSLQPSEVKIIQDFSFQPHVHEKSWTHKVWSALKNWVLHTMGFKFYKDLKYMSIILGLGFTYNFDIVFFELIGTMLSTINIEQSQIVVALTSFHLCDLTARIIYTILGCFCQLRNRYVFMFGMFFSNLGRIGFMLYDDYTWKLCTICLAGFSRGFLETPLPLVISEEYKEEFPMAYSIYMVTTGVISLIFGRIVYLVRNTLESDSAVVFTYAAASFLFFVIWCIELFCIRRRPKKQK